MYGGDGIPDQPAEAAENLIPASYAWRAKERAEELSF